MTEESNYAWLGLGGKALTQRDVMCVGLEVGGAAHDAHRRKRGPRDRRPGPGCGCGYGVSALSFLL